MSEKVFEQEPQFQEPNIIENTEPEVEKGKFNLSELLSEPKNDYTALIEKVVRDSKLEKWGRRDVFTSYASGLAGGLLNFMGFEEDEKTAGKYQKNGRIS